MPLNLVNFKKNKSTKFFKLVESLGEFDKILQVLREILVTIDFSAKSQIFFRKNIFPFVKKVNRPFSTLRSNIQGKNYRPFFEDLPQEPFKSDISSNKRQTRVDPRVVKIHLVVVILE